MADWHKCTKTFNGFEEKNKFVLNFLEKVFFSLFLFLSAKKDFYLKLLKPSGASTTKLFAVVIYYY
jgi:hypothetical protein